MTKALVELGYYLMAGAGGEGPATLMDEARRGEELGFGTAFISERWNVKEASSLVGAACAVTSRMQIATAATNHNTRHPLITGSWATTMHRLSGGRFTLGIGRGIAAIYGAFGIPAVTTAQMEDWAQVMRRLWHGELIFNPDGPMGKYPILFLDPDFNEDIRLALVAFGPQTLALGGRVFDDVILHTYFTPETLQRCVATVKSAAEKAGRDPDSVRVWSCFATVGDHLPEELRLKKTVARLATYLQGYGDLLVQTNSWDPAVLQRFREDSVVTSIGRAVSLGMRASGGRFIGQNGAGDRRCQAGHPALKSGLSREEWTSRSKQRATADHQHIAGQSHPVSSRACGMRRRSVRRRPPGSGR